MENGTNKIGDGQLAGSNVFGLYLRPGPDLWRERFADSAACRIDRGGRLGIAVAVEMKVAEEWCS
jgi:hypothetical protein